MAKNNIRKGVYERQGEMMKAYKKGVKKVIERYKSK